MAAPPSDCGLHSQLRGASPHSPLDTAAAPPRGGGTPLSTSPNRPFIEPAAPSCPQLYKNTLSHRGEGGSPKKMHKKRKKISQRGGLRGKRGQRLWGLWLCGWELTISSRSGIGGFPSLPLTCGEEANTCAHKTRNTNTNTNTIRHTNTVKNTNTITNTNTNTFFPTLTCMAIPKKKYICLHRDTQKIYTTNTNTNASTNSITNAFRNIHKIEQKSKWEMQITVTGGRRVGGSAYNQLSPSRRRKQQLKFNPILPLPQ